MTPTEFKSIRLKLGLTQAQLASILDVPVNTVARRERGELELPRVWQLAMEALQKRRVRRSSSISPND